MGAESEAGVADRQSEPGQSDPNEDCFSRVGLPRRFGRYRLLRLMARGGMGQVFLASTTGVEGAERPVVIKVIRREYSKDPNFLARFLDEARVQAQLQHSAVAQVLEAATHEPTGDPYVVIEYVEGRSLGSMRRRIADVGWRLSWEDAVAAGTALLEGLAHIHERRDARGRPLAIVHRDLSPHNVMVGYGGEIKIIDFGTARGQNRRCHTVAGVVFAKPGYVAPEVANGDSGDWRVDLYAAGVMLWELCAGRRFLQEDATEHTAAVAAGECDLPPIASLVGAPAELDQVIARMTAHDRDERYSSTRKAAMRVGQLLRQAPPLSNGERGVRARIAQLMYNLYPDQPNQARQDFDRLVAAARGIEAAEESEPIVAAPSIEPPEEQEEESNLLAGTRYRIRRELGRGASSVVYEAEHVELGRRAAVKVLDAEHTHSRDFSARFRKEARALSRLVHPGLVRVHDFGQAADGRMFCVMELLEGRTLGAVLEQDEVLGWKRALRVARQCCLALAAAHERGVVHRDIKPANVFVTEQGRVKLIDFSLAKTADEVDAATGEDEASRGLGAMTIFGTPEYMAPEQVAGARVDARADLYSLGCVLYEMLTGRLPFVAASAVSVLDAKLRGNPESPRERVPTARIPRGVNRIVMKALARHPARRFASAYEMADAIADVLDEPTRRRTHRRAVGGAVAAAVMAFAVVLLGRHAGPVLDQLPAQLPWSQSVEQVTEPVGGPSRSGPQPPAPSEAAPTAAPHDSEGQDADDGWLRDDESEPSPERAADAVEAIQVRRSTRVLPVRVMAERD